MSEFVCFNMITCQSGFWGIGVFGCKDIFLFGMMDYTYILGRWQRCQMTRQMHITSYLVDGNTHGKSIFPHAHICGGLI